MHARACWACSIRPLTTPTPSPSPPRFVLAFVASLFSFDEFLFVSISFIQRIGFIFISTPSTPTTCWPDGPLAPSSCAARSCIPLPSLSSAATVRSCRRCLVVILSMFFLIALSFLFAHSYGLSHRHHDESRRYQTLCHHLLQSKNSSSLSFQASRRRAVR